MKRMKDKSALITGGAGFIGSHLVDHLVQLGWSVRVIDNFSTGKKENLKHLKGNPNIEMVVGDLKKFEDCIKAVKGVETVFHLAANPEVRLSTTHPKIHFDENVVATFNLLEAIRKVSDAKCLLFASSSSVYGEPKEIPVSEEAPIRPVSVYGASKASCEALIHAYSKLYGIRALILRYANIIGPSLRHGVIYDLILKLRKNNRKLEILGDGTQIRSYLYITDVINANLMAHRHIRSHFDVFNVGNEDWLSVRELADIVTKTLGLNSVKYIYKPVAHGIGWPGDVKKIALDIRRIKGLGWNPEKGSAEAVKCTADVSVNDNEDFL